MLDFHIRRLEKSLQWLFPAIDFSDATFDKATSLETTVHGTHQDVGCMSHEKVIIFFGGEKDSMGLSAAEEAAKLVRDSIGFGSLANMRGASLDMVSSQSHRSDESSFIFILECDGDGQAAFSAAKFLRLLSKEAQSAESQALLAKATFTVLGISKSNCSFSSASLGDGKYVAARKLASALEKLGATQICEMKNIDAEMQDFHSEVTPHTQSMIQVGLPFHANANHTFPLHLVTTVAGRRSSPGHKSFKLPLAQERRHPSRLPYRRRSLRELLRC